MKSLIRRRREAGAVCPVCRSPDFYMWPNGIPWLNPNITCRSCGHHWQNGRDGGEYGRLYGHPVPPEKGCQ